MRNRAHLWRLLVAFTPILASTGSFSSVLFAETETGLVRPTVAAHVGYAWPSTDPRFNYYGLGGGVGVGASFAFTHRVRSAGIHVEFEYVAHAGTSKTGMTTSAPGSGDLVEYEHLYRARYSGIQMGVELFLGPVLVRPYVMAGSEHASRTCVRGPCAPESGNLAFVAYGAQAAYEVDLDGFVRSLRVGLDLRSISTLALGNDIPPPNDGVGLFFVTEVSF